MAEFRWQVTAVTTRHPSRNYRCPHYPVCLDEAARANRNTLPCVGCEHEHAEAPMILVGDLLGCIALLLVIAADEKACYRLRPESFVRFIEFRLRDYIAFFAGEEDRQALSWRTLANENGGKPLFGG